MGFGLSSSDNKGFFDIDGTVSFAFNENGIILSNSGRIGNFSEPDAVLFSTNGDVTLSNDVDILKDLNVSGNITSVSDVSINGRLISNGEPIVVSSTDTEELHSFPISEYRSVKFIIQTTTSTEYSIREILATHNNVDGFLTEYAVVSTSEDLEIDNYAFYINSQNAILSVTPSNSSERTIKIHSVLITN